MPSTTTKKRVGGGQEASHLLGMMREQRGSRGRGDLTEATDSGTSGAFAFLIKPSLGTSEAFFSLTDPQEHRSGMRKMFRS